MQIEARVGSVSFVDYDSGMVQVFFEESVTSNMLPVLTFNGEYNLPKQDEKVIVLYLSNSTEVAIVLGTFWNEENVPEKTGRGKYYKEFGVGGGMEYDENTETLTIKAKKIVLDCEELITTEEGVDS